MGWMTYWPSPFPPVAHAGHGSQLIDIDGQTYTDYCLGEGAALQGQFEQGEAARQVAGIALGQLLPEPGGGFFFPKAEEETRQLALQACDPERGEEREELPTDVLGEEGSH